MTEFQVAPAQQPSKVASKTGLKANVEVPAKTETAAKSNATKSSTAQGEQPKAIERKSLFRRFMDTVMGED